MNIHKVLGENVKTLRLQCGLTIEKLSNDAGIAFSTLSLIERGHGNPSLEMLEKLGAVLNVPVHKLLEPNNRGGVESGRNVHHLIHQEQISKLPTSQRRMINNLLGIILSLIDSTDRRNDYGGKNSDM